MDEVEFCLKVVVLLVILRVKTIASFLSRLQIPNAYVWFILFQNMIIDCLQLVTC